MNEGRFFRIKFSNTSENLILQMLFSSIIYECVKYQAMDLGFSLFVPPPHLHYICQSLHHKQWNFSFQEYNPTVLL